MFACCAARPDLRSFLHDALPISRCTNRADAACRRAADARHRRNAATAVRSEEHTSELQSRLHLVCRLLLAQKNTRAIAPQPASAIPSAAPALWPAPEPTPRYTQS